MCRKQLTESEKKSKSEAEYPEFIEICVDEGWSPTRCTRGCIVEPDGICPHGFKSYLLEQGLI